MEFTRDELWLMDGDDHEETTGFDVPPNVPLSPSPSPSPEMLYRKEASTPLNTRSSRHSQSAQASPTLFDSKGASSTSFGARSSKHSRRSARRASPGAPESRKETNSPPAARSSKHSRKSRRVSPTVYDRKDLSSPSNARSSKHSRRGARQQVDSSRRKSPDSDPETEETVPISISSPGQSFSFEINLPLEADVSPLSSYESVIGAMIAKSVDRALENSANFADIRSPRRRGDTRSTAKASPRYRHQDRQRRSDGDEKQDRRRSANDSDGDDDENQHRRRSNASEEEGPRNAQNRRRSNEFDDFSKNRDGQERRLSNQSEGLSRGRSNESQYHDRQNRCRSMEFEDHDQQNRRRSNESEGYDQPHPRRISNESSEGYDQQSSRRSNEQDDGEDRQPRRRRRRSGEAGQETRGRNRPESNDNKDADERYRSRSQTKDEAGRRKQKHRSQSRARSTETEKQALYSSDEDSSSESSADEKRSNNNYFRLSDTDGLKAIVPVITPVILRDSQSPYRQQMMSDVKEKGNERALKWTLLRGEMDRVSVSPVHKVVADVKHASVKRFAKLEEIRGGMERAKASPIRRILEDVKDTGSKRASKWEELQRNMERVKASPVQSRTIGAQTASEITRETSSPKRPSKWGAIRSSANLIQETKMATDDSSGRRERSSRRSSRTSKDASKWEGLRSGMSFINETKRRSGESRRRRNNRDGSPRVDEPSTGGGSHVRSPKRDGTRMKPAEIDTGGEGSQIECTHSSDQQINEASSGGGGSKLSGLTSKLKGIEAGKGSQRWGSLSSGQQVKGTSSGGVGSKWSGLRSKLVDAETGGGSQTRNSSQRVNEASARGDGSRWSGLSSKWEETEVGGEGSQVKGNRSSSSQRINEASACGGGSKWSGIRGKLAERGTGEGNQTRRSTRSRAPQVALKGANAFINNAKKQTDESKRRRSRRPGGSQIVNDASSGRKVEASRWKALKGASAFINQAKINREQSERRLLMQLDESPIDVNRSTPGSSTTYPPSKWSSLRGGVDALKEAQKKTYGEREKTAKSDSGFANVQLDDGCHLVQPRIKPVILSTSSEQSSFAWSGLREGIGSFNSESAKVQDQKTTAQDKLLSKWSGLRHAFAFISEAKKKSKVRTSGRDASAPSSSDNPRVKTSAAVFTGPRWEGLSNVISETKRRAENSRHRRKSMDNAQVENETKSRTQRSRRHGRKSMEDVIEESEQKTHGPPAPKVRPHTSIPGKDGCVLVAPKVRPVILGSSLNSTTGVRLSESPSKWAALKKSNDFINNTKKKAKKTTRKVTAAQTGDESKPVTTKSTDPMRPMEKESNDSGGEQAISASLTTWDGIRKASDLIIEKKKRREDSRARQKSLASLTPPIKFTQAETPACNGMGGEIQFVPSPLVSLRKQLDSSQWGLAKVAATGIAPKSDETSAASGSSANDPSKWEPLKKQMKDTCKEIDFDASKDIGFHTSKAIGFDAFKDIEFNTSRGIEVNIRVSDRSVLVMTDTNRESTFKKDVQVCGLKNGVDSKRPGDERPSRWTALKAEMESNRESDTGDVNKESEDKNEIKLSMFSDLKSEMETKEAGTTVPSHCGVSKTQMDSKKAAGVVGSRERGRASKWNGLKGGTAFINKAKKLAEENQKKGSKWNGLKGGTGTAFINKTKKLAEENEKKGSKWNGLKGGMAFINKTKKLAQDNEKKGSKWDGLKGDIKTKQNAEDNQKEGSNSTRTGKRSLWDGLKTEAGEGGGLHNHIEGNPVAREGSPVSSGERRSKWAGLKNGMVFISKAKQRSEERKAQFSG